MKNRREIASRSSAIYSLTNVKKLLRYAIVGVVSSGIYAVTTFAYIHFASLQAAISSMLAYLMAIPVSFIGHRNFTFRSKGHISGEFIRFCFVHFTNLFISYYVMGFAIQFLLLPYWYGILLCVIITPVVAFIIMNLWVFIEQSHH